MSTTAANFTPRPPSAPTAGANRRTSLATSGSHLETVNSPSASMLVMMARDSSAAEIGTSDSQSIAATGAAAVAEEGSASSVTTISVVPTVVAELNHPVPVMPFPPGADAFLEKILANEQALLGNASILIEEEFNHETLKSRRLQQLHTQRERRAKQEEDEASNEILIKGMLEQLGDAIRDRETTLRSDGYQTFLFGNEYLYEGDWKNSKMHGRGVMRSGDGGQIYEGEWFLGMRNGNGTHHVLGIETTYDGKWSDGKKHGKGELTEPEGVYRGEFREGKIQGLGEYIFADGHVYRGEWLNEVFHGAGVYIYPSGTKYDGMWRGGQEHGRGTRVHRNGDVYSGEWVGGRRHGTGTYSSLDFQYDGQWQYNLIQGKGSCTYADGSTYVGQWVKGKFHGSGTLTDSKGRVYRGEFVNGQRHGEGSYEGEGITYAGPWQKDKKVGPDGSMAFISGGVYTGPWEDDLPHGKGVFDTTTGVRDRVTYKKGVCVERDDSMSFKKFNAELEINMILSPEAERKSRFAAKKRKEAIEQQKLIQMQIQLNLSGGGGGQTPSSPQSSFLHPSSSSLAAGGGGTPTPSAPW